MICSHCGGRIMSTFYLGGEVDRECAVCSRLYLTPAEIRERDAFLARRGEGARGGRVPMMQEVSL